MQAYRFALSVDGKEIELPWELYEDGDEALRRGQALLAGVVDTGRAKTAFVGVFADIEPMGVWAWSVAVPEITWTATK